MLCPRFLGRRTGNVRAIPCAGEYLTCDREDGKKPCQLRYNLRQAKLNQSIGSFIMIADTHYRLAGGAAGQNFKGYHDRRMSAGRSGRAVEAQSATGNER